MLFRYLYDRKSWIVFFLLSLLFVDLLIWIDNGISIRGDSMLYLNMLLILAMVTFLGWRCRKETKYPRALTELAEEIQEDWVETLPSAYLYQEEATNELLRAVDHWYWHKISNSNAARSMEQDYIAAWVHEVKTPLTAVKLTIDANRDNPAMRKIESEWLRIHLLIDQQLYISRLPSLEADYMLEQTGIQRLAAQEVRELTSWCVEKNIAVEFEGEETLVRTDRKWCRFIIRQILTNAVKYSPEGGMICLSTTVTPDGHVRMTIRDEGPGIAAHELPRIFDKGFTGGNGRLHNAATGLGLYLAQTVAVKIGISLTVQSEPNTGTTMQMTFTVINAFESVRTSI
ncbi:sensor histidine kinase [Paenibacillus donghaensis]|uniref:sensor histidine kinase n=1 Tax=Paenibacillus donghaensis TaxID=414771 RepID=UPI001FED08EB|nr:sensor histidine kinase [Paenibacillus donghaensis]